MITPHEFKLGMRRLAAGVSIVTTALDETPHGIVATSTSAMTSDPPTLLVCINRSASCHEAISAAGVFCVNVLGQEDVELAALFSDSRRRGERFDGRPWRRLATGAPVLPSSVVAFDCVVDKVIAYETHTIFIGLIKGLERRDSELDPLLYLDGAFCRVAALQAGESGPAR